LSKSLYSDEGMEFRGDLNIQKIIYDQITLINRARSSGDPLLYEECVKQLQLLLPWQQQVEVEDEQVDYEEQIAEWRPVMIDGEYGSSDPKNPDLINVPGTLRLQPDLLFKKIMLKLQNVGYTHKQDEQMNDGGDIPEGEIPPPTPTLAVSQPVEDEEEDE
jgi:hypothetical protein